jgi:hypothetical protein
MSCMAVPACCTTRTPPSACSMLCGDERLDLARGRRRTLRQRPHFSGHHRKATPLLAGARRFHGRVECQDVGLEGDAVDGADDVADAGGRAVDALHGAHHLIDDLPAPLGGLSVAGSQLVASRPRFLHCCCTVEAICFHGRTPSSSRLGRTVLGARTQVVGAAGDLGAGLHEGLSTTNAPAPRCHAAHPASASACQHQARCFVGAPGARLRGEVPIAHGVDVKGHFLQPPVQAPCQRT